MGNSNIIYDALKAQFEAQQKMALAQLTIYFTNPVGIGEHPQIIDEMVAMTKSLAEANDCLETLKKTFEVNDQANGTNDSN
jgi:methylaspartate ammonia-lyase